MKKLILPLMIGALLPNAWAAPKDSRCYELRVYYAAPGKLDDLHARFRNHTVKLFEKHGLSNLGYWVPRENPDNKLIYLLAFPSRVAAKESWKKFMADPDWRAAQKASEVNGRLVTKVESTYLTATDYSPAIAASIGDRERVFELRTYRAAPGRLDALKARFRDHTVGLFRKHGMSQFGYWTPQDLNRGADNTLVYLLVHASRDAAAASFNAFRADPDWIKARADSEAQAGGSLTAKGGVQSLFLKPTDYSPTR